jgi:hypothetical protein
MALSIKTRNVPEVPPTKRQKLLERNYAASTVKSDLARGGIPFPCLRQVPRVIQGADVDISKIEHVSAKDFDKRSVLAPATTYISPFDFRNDCSSIVNELLQDARSFYALPVGEQKQQDAGKQGDSESESSTSSMTDSPDDEDDQKNDITFVTMGDALSISKIPRYVK